MNVRYTHKVNLSVVVDAEVPCAPGVPAVWCNDTLCLYPRDQNARCQHDCYCSAIHVRWAHVHPKNYCMLQMQRNLQTLSLQLL